jgi:hypothetical protein
MKWVLIVNMLYWSANPSMDDYKQHSVPGWSSKTTCEAALKDLKSRNYHPDQMQQAWCAPEPQKLVLPTPR